MPSSFQIHRINSPPTTTTATAATVSAAVMGDGHDKKNGREIPNDQIQNQNPTWAIPGLQTPLPDNVSHYHNHILGPTQGCSAVVQTINADVDTVWSVVRRFDNPQAYKHFLKSCQVITGTGDGKVGTLREVQVVSGLPAATSTERLEILDDENHVISFSVVGGEHRLTNYRSVTTLHVKEEGKETVVVESYVVDIPEGNTKEETCVFADTIVRCNLVSLAKIAENLVKERNDICAKN